MADKKITSLTELTSLSNDDIFPVVDDPGGMPETKKITWENIILAINAISDLTGDVTASGPGSVTATIANNAVTLAKMADMATASLLGRNSAGSGDPEVLSIATVQSILGIADGWIADSNTWTYASSTSFTINGNVTEKFPKGTKIKLANSGTKYFYVMSTAYSAPNTTITVSGGSTYALVSGAIYATYYSYAESPQGFPNYFDYVPTWTAVTTNPAIGSGVLVGRFSMTGKLITATIDMLAAGDTTFGIGNWSFELPAAVGVYPAATCYPHGMFHVLDSGTTYYIGVVVAARYVTVINTFLRDGTNVVVINATAPHTWAANDRFGAQISYLVA